eukprot:4974062-Karenia_brevis.AAC.1
MALQYLIRNLFRVQDVIAVQLGKGVSQLGKVPYADKSVLIYYYDDNSPDFHCDETKDTAIDARA